MSAVTTIGLNYADRLNLATQTRYQALETIFNKKIAPLSSLMGPMNDGPEWPSGAAWVATTHNDHACIISDGLSDPWVERNKPETGLGLEVFIESPDIPVPENQDFDKLADTWMFPMMAEISHTLASYPRLCEKLLAGEVLSMEFNIDHIKDGRGRVGALLHQPLSMPNNWQNEWGEIRLFAATVLTPDELRQLRGRGVTGRTALLDKLYLQGTEHRSLLHRESIASF